MADAQPTTGWRPEEGDTVSGPVVDLDRGWSDFTQSFYPIVTLETDSGPVAVHGFHAALRNRLAAIAPKLGDRLAITYQGKKKSKDGTREISIYTVEAPDREMDAGSFWDSVGGTLAPQTPGRTPAAPAQAPLDDDIPF